MKKVKYLAMLLAAGMFAACSDNLEDAGAGNAGGTTPSTTEGYVKVAINMPTTSGNVSRANDTGSGENANITLDDGEVNEYKVTDGIIAFFKCATTNPDEDATFVRAYKMNSLSQSDDQSDPHVSTRVTRIQQAPLVGADENLYALVILNPVDAVIKVDDNDMLVLGSATSKTLTSNSKLSDLGEALTNQNLTNYIGADKNDFMMVTSPFSTKDGDDTNLSTTAKATTLNLVHVYKTETEAEGKDADQIYVERVVAKVTLTGENFSPNTEGKYQMTVDPKDTENNYSGDIVTLEGWVLNVTNKSTYLIRNVSGFTSTDWLSTANSSKIARFVGTSKVDGNEYYRIYWAKDPNYTSSESRTDVFNIYHTDGTANMPQNNDWNAKIETATADNALYCLENTMDYGQQKDNETTGVLMKTTYNVVFKNETPAYTGNARDFFVCGSEANKCLLNDVSLSEPTNAKILGLKSKIIEATKNAEGAAQLTADEIEINSEADAGRYDSREKIENLINLKKATWTDETKEKKALYDQIWNSIGTIAYYKGGISYYYTTLIRHFNDTETPWTTGVYNNSHLGRYGVVRNNWYQINVTNISGPGDPSVDTPDGESDDKDEGYIKAEINVLSWAKRTQDVEL